ncbi:PAS domain S-box protein [Halorubrum yunnanense]|uniref:PAS domain S-box protein n=1 Tax=Halorubrum yunnanense TaxID=1526162 RepID=A0ABD5YKF2_9EURY|nr:PAS domain S-box protein [Halorubrum yunnanense]
MDRFPEALDGIPDAVLIVDAEGIVRAANRRVESVFGYAPDDLEGRAFETLIFDPDGGAAGRELHRYVVDPEPRSMSASLDLFARRADGTDVPVTLSLGPFDRDGETHLVVTLVDAEGGGARFEFRGVEAAEAAEAAAEVADVDGGADAGDVDD